MHNPEHLRPAKPETPVVLLVDDDVMVLNVARITREDHGYFVLTAENGEAGLFLPRQFPYFRQVIARAGIVAVFSGPLF
jgi:CheY-like chemotaxis protein